MKLLLDKLATEIDKDEVVQIDDFKASMPKKQTIIPKLALNNPVLFFGIWLRLLGKRAQQCVWILSVAAVLSTASGSDVAAQNTGCVGGTCPDVPTDGISYTSGSNTVNVGDGVPGTTEVGAGVIGINLTQSGVNGTGAIWMRTEPKISKPSSLNTRMTSSLYSWKDCVDGRKQ
jgi:hypothetical protein